MVPQPAWATPALRWRASGAGKKLSWWFLLSLSIKYGKEIFDCGCLHQRPANKGFTGVESKQALRPC